MSSLNNIVIESDILSERGKIQSIWDSFIESLNLKTEQQRFIVKTFTEKIFNHLYLDDEECLDAIRTLWLFSNRLIVTDVFPSSFLQFCCYASDSLNEYISINSEFSKNNKFNTLDNSSELSAKDESLILSEMFRCGLIDSTKVQSLLDNQSLELVTSANSLMAKCRRVQSPSINDRTGSINNNSLVTLKDFGTDESRILDCVKKLINENFDSFPESIEDLKQLIFPIKNFNSQVLYSQDTYLPNLASYGILSSTVQCLQDSSELDSDTAIYELSNAMDKVNNLMKECNQSICLISYMVLCSTVLRYLNKNGENNSLKTLMRDRLNNAYLLYNNLDQTDSRTDSYMIRLPDELKDICSMVEHGKDSDFTTEELDEALDGILSSIEELGTELEHQSIKLANGLSSNVSTLSSLTESTQVGLKQVDEKDIWVNKLTKVAETVHNDLNHCLLESDYEKAAESIALEMALMERLSDNQTTYPLVTNNILESIERDISTYKNIVNYSSTGIDSYMESASEQIGKVLESLI